MWHSYFKIGPVTYKNDILLVKMTIIVKKGHIKSNRVILNSSRVTLRVTGNLYLFFDNSAPLTNFEV